MLLLNLKFVASARFYHPHSVLNRCKAQLFPHAGLFLEVRRAHLQYFQLQYKLKLEQAFDIMISGHQVQLSLVRNFDQKDVRMQLRQLLIVVIGDQVTSTMSVRLRKPT